MPAPISSRPTTPTASRPTSSPRRAAAPRPRSTAPTRATPSPAQNARQGSTTKGLTKAMESNFRTTPGTTDNSWHDRLPANLRKHADSFTEAGRKHGVDPRFLAAISMHETGNGTSNAFRNKNNAMGVMGNDRSPRRFDSVASSINSQAGSLRNNPAYAGRTTASEIQQAYAPVGAHNDARNQNSEWLRRVSGNLTALGADPSAPMIFRD